MKKICKYCNKEFETKREWQKFCLRKEQQLYWREIYSGNLVNVYKRIEQLEEKLNIKKESS